MTKAKTTKRSASRTPSKVATTKPATKKKPASAAKKRSKYAHAKRANPAANAAEVRRAEAEYKRMHWGQEGERGTRAYVAGDPREPQVELGELVSITYRTRKGEDMELVDYVHAFKKTRPRLTYVTSSRKLIIAGGTYDVTERGIVG